MPKFFLQIFPLVYNLLRKQHMLFHKNDLFLFLIYIPLEALNHLLHHLLSYNL